MFVLKKRVNSTDIGNFYIFSTNIIKADENIKKYIISPLSSAIIHQKKFLSNFFYEKLYIYFSSLA